MRILFCDDDIQFTNQLKEYVEEYFSEKGGLKPEFDLFSRGDALLQYNQPVDIAFIDVEMPGVSGIYAGAHLEEINPYVKIFIVTSYPDSVDEAMRYQVFRYLSKPVDKNRLFRNLKDALYQLNMEIQTIPIETADGILTISSDQLMYIEKTGRKTAVYTTQERIQSVQTMEDWHQRLKLPCFYEPYRGFLINMRYVHKFSRDTIILRYQSKEAQVYLARRKYTHFKETYLLYMESMR